MKGDKNTLNNELIENNKIVIYTTDDGQVEIEVRLEDEKVWLLKIQWQNYLILQEII